MAAYNTIDLGRFTLAPGDGTRIDGTVLPGELELGGERYSMPGEGVVARVDVSRTTTGYALRLRFEAPVEGPCTRCLGEARNAVSVDAREVDQPAAGDAELRSPYVSGAEVDLGAWAHDALALAMPEKFLCRPDCAGLCPECGKPLNDADPDEHRHGVGRDPRFAALDKLRPGP